MTGAGIASFALDLGTRGQLHSPTALSPPEKSPPPPPVSIKQGAILTPILCALRKIMKSDYYVRYVCLPAWNNSNSAGRLLITFDV
jgi:hypothetical protein